MNTLSRKQREIAERHALLLDIGRRLVDSEGYRNLSMDRIAEISEYSKGTVYQHFSCKEEILIQLCNHNAIGLKSLFERAHAFDGTTREKMLALFLAHQLWVDLNPNCHELMQTLCGGGTKEKVSPESLESHNRHEFEILGVVSNIVEQAVTAGELTLPPTLKIPELVFSLWSIAHGGLQLRALDLPLQEMGVEDPMLAIIGAIDAMFDGFGWHPLSSEHNYKESIQQIYNSVFLEEYQQTAHNRERVKQ